MFRDMFGETHVSIKDNAVLEKAANHLLLLLQRKPELLNGATIGEIDRKIMTEFWMEEGLHAILTETQREQFMDFFLKATEGEVISRARRYLVEKDIVRLPAKAVIGGERFRKRITGAMG